MALHVQVTRRKGLLHVHGQWESRLPLFQNFTVRPKEGETAAETVELALMEEGLVASWLWSARNDSPVLEGQFTHEGSHKEVRDSLARFCDLPKLEKEE